MNLLDRLTDDKIQQGHHFDIIGNRIYCYDSTASTNDIGWHLADSNEPEGIVIFAEEQSQGRGRQGAVWHCPKSSGLLFSVLTRPPKRFLHTNLTTDLAALAVAETLHEMYGLNPTIKHPNDILINGKKIAGILSEKHLPEHTRTMIVGVGLNVNTSSDQLPKEIRSLATSIQICIGKTSDRNNLAGAVLAKMDHYYQKVLQGNENQMYQRWSRFVALKK